MSLAICTFITWLVIIVLSLISKKLSEIEMVFVYFVNTIFEIIIFAILNTNLNWIEVNHNVEKAFADLVLRFFMVPLVFVITANILMYSWKYLKWIIIFTIILSFLLMQALLSKLGILCTHNWNVIYTLVLFSIFALFSSLMAWFIRNVDGKDVSEN
ncbi:MAG: hypothetical protein Q8935_23690 [Bacillota bacterium]|nr:hypothetical protein [Bacillota bacterium]